MELIKNTGFSSFTSKKENFCPKCTNRGRIKVVDEGDREGFEREFDRLADPGTLEMYICYDRAIDKFNHHYCYCPDCENGQLYKGEYPKYEGI
ncbi:MAG TPA: hypothetical protein DHW61_05200 [Lachnoclostridium phytofermentans]|uniref:Uncharacterized protein n=1 Tax=Lachnoclostridium phytofermentans TaxID=66219 RepID=A0A3D2X3W8_9FIRM|nr:hypothetical protein [Lachnoclostridium sp.]HCL01802.1 hypothetical protein [Lachnoclostridium phytofermentans]